MTLSNNFDILNTDKPGGENKMKYNTLDELLDSEEFKDFMDKLENDGFFDQFENEEDGNTLADTGRYPE